MKKSEKVCQSQNWYAKVEKGMLATLRIKKLLWLKKYAMIYETLKK